MHVLVRKLFNIHIFDLKAFRLDYCDVGRVCFVSKQCPIYSKEIKTSSQKIVSFRCNNSQQLVNFQWRKHLSNYLQQKV